MRRQGVQRPQFKGSPPSPVASFSPASIAGLQLWLDASDASTITLDGSDNVEQWRDKSGNLYHATQAAVLSRPSYLPDGVNGKASLYYGGGTKFVSTPVMPLLSNPGWTILMAARFDTADFRRLYSWQSNIRAFGITAPNRLIFDFHPTVDNIGRTIVTEADYANIAAFTWQYTAQWYSSSQNTRGIMVGTPASSYSSTGAAPDVYTASSSLHVGRDVPNVASFRGSIGEVLIYDRVLDSTDRAAVLSYLASKWDML